MPNRLSRLVLPAAVLSLLAAAPATVARTVQRVPHKHDIIPTGSTMPGQELQPIKLPAPSYQVGDDAQLTAALQNAQPGQVIHLANGGRFSQIVDTKARSGWVTVSGAGDAQRPVIDGARLWGTQHLRFTKVKFTSVVNIQNHPVRKTAQPAENIQVLNSEIDCGATATAGGGTAIVIRQGARNIAFSGDYIHDCTVGFSSVAQDLPSSYVSITHSLFEDFYGDAIDLGAMHNLTIADDIIRDIQHSPGVTYHDDGIQFLGNTSGVAITHNVIANSLDQLLFIQDAVKGLTTNTSVNSHILVSHNLMYGNAAFAVQAQGALATSFIDNTIWDNGDGSLLLRKSGYTGIAPTDTVVEGNILESFATSGVHPALDANNLIEHVSSTFRPGPGDIIGTPSFVDSTAGDFELVPGTVGSGTTDPASTTATSAGTATDSTSSTSSSTPLGAFSPGAPEVAYGAPLWGLG